MRFRVVRELLALVLVLALVGDRVASSQDAVGEAKKSIENLQIVAPDLFSGGQPEGEAAFAALAKLGVKTVLSVDAAAPEVELARKYGMRYIHLPIGYDGLSRARQCEIAETARRSQGPVFVHCHHGKHRGPAATAVIARDRLGWSTEQAQAWMKSAGTAAKYHGLYRSVGEFRPIRDEERATVAAELPESVPPVGFAKAMLTIDHAWEGLAPLGAKSKATDAELLGQRESLREAATSLRELLREFARLEAAQARGEAFLSLAEASEQAVAALEDSLASPEAQPTSATDWKASAAKIEATCAACHARHRDAK